MTSSRRLSLALCGAGLVLALSGALLTDRGLPPVAEVSVSRWTGYGALIFLMLSQAMAPLARFKLVSPAFQAFGRRDFGICCAFLATLHGAYGWLKFLHFNLWEALDETTWLQAGVVAWVLLAALWLTSYPWWVRKLHVKIWKSLHHLTYVALALSWLHFVLSPWGNREVALVAGAIILAMWLFRLGPRRLEPRKANAEEGLAPNPKNWPTPRR